MSTLSLIRVICSLYPWCELYVHCIPDASYMSTVSLMQVICPLHPVHELLCPLYRFRLRFISGNRTREFNIPKSQQYAEPEVFAYHLQNVIFLQSAWKWTWRCLVFGSFQVQISGRRQASLIKVSRDFFFHPSRTLENVTPKGASSDVRGDVLAPPGDFGNE
jgi:hypothetical protein